MGIEIERKFLVRGTAWRTGEGTRTCQAYLCADPGRCVRVRVAGDAAWITIKGPDQAGVRAEYEYPVPRADAEELLALCATPLVEKIRYRVPFAGHVFEVDEFLGGNAGLIVAEVEMATPGETVELPDWIGEEVTGDDRYHNTHLARHPFTRW